MPLVEKKVNPPINAEQINYALELLEKRHPLKTTPWRVTLPFIKYLCFCCMKPRKKTFNGALKRAIRRKLELSVPKSDMMIEEDPFLLLGYGMNSYFEIMR